MILSIKVLWSPSLPSSIYLHQRWFHSIHLAPWCWVLVVAEGVEVLVCFLINCVSSDFFVSLGSQGRAPVPQFQEPPGQWWNCRGSWYIKKQSPGADQLPSQVMSEILRGRPGGVLGAAPQGHLSSANGCPMGHGDQCGQSWRNTGCLWEICLLLHIANSTGNEPNRIGLWARFFSLFMASLSICSSQISFLYTISKKRNLFFYWGNQDKKRHESEELTARSPMAFLLSQISHLLPSFFRFSTQISLCLSLTYNTLTLQVWPKLLQLPLEVVFCFQLRSPAPFPVVSVSPERSFGCVFFLIRPAWLPGVSKLRTKSSPWHLNPSKTWLHCLFGLGTLHFSWFSFPCFS